jgi:hypothetical protein
MLNKEGMMQQKGTLTVEFVPQTSQRLEFNPFFSDPSLVNEIKKRLDNELRQRGINVRNSTMEPDPKTFGLRYQAEYDPPRRYGVAIGTVIAGVVEAVIRAVVQAVKAVIRLIVRFVKAVVKFIQKLIVRIQTLIQYWNEALKRWQPLAGGRQTGELNPENPEKGLNEMERDVERTGSTSGTFTFSSPWFIFGVLAVAVLLLTRK